MKKLLLLLVALVLTFTLAGCTGEEELPALPDTVDMTNVDDYLGRPDVQYIDLRNFDEKLKSGYIQGFESIPFFQYLEATEILVRTDGNWTFAAEDLVDEAALEAIFDSSKAIFLMCGSGTRAEFVLEALESLGYENVYNVGGFSAYAGDAKVLGDGSFELVKSGSFTPGTYFGVDPITGYTATVVVNAKGGIENVVFDAIYHGTTKQVLDTAYTLASGKTWKSEADALAAYVLANQGWGEIVLDEAALAAGVNALTVPRHFIYIDNDASPDAVAGVTIGAEGFVLAWNAAISQASTSDLGVVAIDVTPEEWAAAHEPAFDYVDGVYFGMDEAHGYMVKVTIEGSEIVDVFFDAIYGVYQGCDDGAGNVNAATSKGDCADEWEVYEYTTKQILQEGYTLASGKTWAAEADELAAAILKYQEWRTEWAIIVSTTGGHDKFDTTDQEVMDDVAGVTIGIEGFKLAFEEAMAQAQPTS